MKNSLLTALLLSILPPAALANDYPTHERVQYVFECMADHGGQSYANLYKCSCSIDYIAAHMSYDQFVEADTYTRGQHAAGERGGILREGKRADEERASLAALKEHAEHRCFPQMQ